MKKKEIKKKEKETKKKNIDLKKPINLSFKEKKNSREKSFTNLIKGKTCFAFDFGDYATKIAIAKISNDKIELKNLLVVENDERKSKIETSNVNEWHDKLSKAFSTNNISTFGQYAVCTVGSRYYISRQMEVPYAEEKDMLGLIAYEMSQSLSLDKDSYYFQYKLISTYEKNGGKVCNVWVAALKKTLCDTYYELLDSFKLKPLIMDINVDGLERIFAADSKLGEFAKGGSVATIDFGMHGTEVNIFNNGKYIQGSNVNVGDGKFVSAAKNVLGIQISDIHNGNKLIVDPKIVYGITRQPEMANSKIFASVLEEWLAEVGMIIKRYNISYPNAQVSKIFMYGGSPQQAWLKYFVEEYLGIKVLLIKKLDCVDVPKAYEQEENLIPQCLNAISLFLMK